jgi:sporulation protein YlmC with PRC-barrel domain
MRLGELLGREVVTESGERLGRVREVQGELEEGRLRVTGIVAGKRGILERFGVGAKGKRGARRARRHGNAGIPWHRVVRVGRDVVVKDST